MVVNEASCMVLDRAAALERVGGDEELLAEIARIFLDEYPKNVEAILSAIERGNAKDLERAAHSLKGSVANFSAPGVFEAAFTLEKMGRRGEVEGARECLDELEAELERLHPALEALLM